MTAASCDERGQHPSRTRCDLSGSTENRLLGYSARDNASRVLAMCEVHGKVSAACPCVACRLALARAVCWRSADARAAAASYTARGVATVELSRSGDRRRTPGFACVTGLSADLRTRGVRVRGSMEFFVFDTQHANNISMDSPEHGDHHDTLEMHRACSKHELPTLPTYDFFSSLFHAGSVVAALVALRRCGRGRELARIIAPAVHHLVRWVPLLWQQGEPHLSRHLSELWVSIPRP